MKRLTDELESAKRCYQHAREEYPLKEVRRDDILDSMVLAAAGRNRTLTTVPTGPSPNEPRIYYPEFDVPVLEVD